MSATVSSIPLIASSVMSKKIAAGADKILIDIKVGSGALLQNREDAQKLSELMIKIGKVYHREVRTIISDMDTPLGYAIGNSLEVMEALDVLQGKEYDTNLVNLCVELATEMISMGKNISSEEAGVEVKESINKGRAYQKFLEIVKYQGGDLDSIGVSARIKKIRAEKSGVIKKIDALKLGKLSISLGAGRETKEDTIDYSAGIKLNKLLGDKVKKGDVLATIYTNEKVKLPSSNEIFKIS